MRIELEVELLTDVALSSTARTLGAHETLDYIPGRVLWGVAASRAYTSGMPEAEAFRLFQQGAVRFFDAVPCPRTASNCGPGGTREVQRAAPTPRSWHRRKRGPELRNFVFPDQRSDAEKEQAQYEALPDAWRMPSGSEVNVTKNFTMRTAIESSGRSRSGYLFGLASIAAGTRMHVNVDGPDADVEQVCALLTGECRVGRSRSAEYGRVAIRRIDGPVRRLTLSSSGTAKRVAILCLSRLALRDPRTGSPTYRPIPGAFALNPDDGWRLDLASSFVRTAAYSPYHEKRGRPEIERSVIEHGSVLVFEGPGVSIDDLRARLRDGVGEWRHQGLGDVAVNPEWLSQERPTLPEDETNQRFVRAPAVTPDDELYRWASLQADHRSRAREQFEFAERDARELSRFDLPPSQWGMLRTLARQARYRVDGPAWLSGEVERLLGSGIRALSGRWGKQVNGRTAAEALRGLLNDAGADSPVRLELLASRAARPDDESQKGGGQ